MKTQSNSGQRRFKPARRSWHVRKQLRDFDDYDAKLVRRRFDEVLGKYRTEHGFPRLEEAHRIYLPDDLFLALMTMLEKVTLPMARYDLWCWHGDDQLSSGIVSSLFEDCGIYADRAQQCVHTLLAIEPFPSKKAVDRFKIERVMTDAGDIWPVCRKAEHDKASH